MGERKTPRSSRAKGPMASPQVRPGGVRYICERWLLGKFQTRLVEGSFV